MPWCDDCSKFWNPPELGEGAMCPTCGRSLVAPGPKAATVASPTGGTAAPAGTPAERSPGSQSGDRERSLQPAAVAVESTAESKPASTGDPGTGTAPKGAPWHFKLLVVGVTVYMIYRIYWLIEWLPKHI